MIVPVRGECRDQRGGYSARIESSGGALPFSQCHALCEGLGLRCDALDVDGPPPANGTDPLVPWCAAWGTSLTERDVPNGTAAFRFECDDTCATGKGLRVCRGVPDSKTNNWCFRREPFC